MSCNWSVGESCLNVVYGMHMLDLMVISVLSRYVLQLRQRANGHARFQSQHMEGAKSQFFLTQDRPNIEH